MMTGDRGSASLELVLLTPVLVLLVLLVAFAGRTAQTRADVDRAARDAARAASIARTPETAVEDGGSAASATLTAGDVTCRTLTVDVDTSTFVAGGSVRATVTCAVDLTDLGLLGLPGSKSLTATFTQPVDVYRGLP